MVFLFAPHVAFASGYFQGCCPGTSDAHAKLAWDPGATGSKLLGCVFFPMRRMWVKQCHVYHAPVITIFIGGINHSQVGGLWHHFTHIKQIKVVINECEKESIPEPTILDFFVSILSQYWSTVASRALTSDLIPVMGLVLELALDLILSLGNSLILYWKMLKVS